MLEVGVEDDEGFRVQKKGIAVDSMHNDTAVAPALPVMRVPPRVNGGSESWKVIESKNCFCGALGSALAEGKSNGGGTWSSTMKSCLSMSLAA